MVNPIFLALSVVFACAGLLNQFLLWFEIDPTLRRLGHKDGVLWITARKNGFHTLWDYKRSRIAEQKPLTQWWAYWISLWTTMLAWGVGLIMVLMSP